MICGGVVEVSLILLSDIRRGLVEEAMTYGGDVMRSNAGPGPGWEPGCGSNSGSIIKPTNVSKSLFRETLEKLLYR